ncbi:C2 domain containing protein [Histomonas meleagridis]|uniref:C2 domain containing protein n=1 Tax=Histomonas meleagridis TaxID=135588 RepID=UPI00355A0272|nr:C2 domain containing protein [Histomonas meleagridis]KAH0798249.1 C2 domain containing protein [Histomonas meleagridis]
MCAVRLHVKVVEGKDLLQMDLGKSDPYVVLRLKSQKSSVKTKVMKNTLNPVWNEEFDLVTEKPDDVLLVNMFDEDVAKDDKMIDELQFKVSDFKVGADVAKITKDLTLTKKKGKGKKAGKLTLEIQAFGDAQKPKKEHKKDDKKKDDKKDDKKRERRGSRSSKKGAPTGNMKISVVCHSARGLIAADRNGTSDPYLVFNIKGSSERVHTKFIENSLEPVWNETVEINGVDQTKDAIEIVVFDKDKKVDLKKNDQIGYAIIKVAEIKFGEQVEIPLVKMSKKKPAKDSKPGDAGFVKLTFTTESEVKPQLALHVRVVSAKDLKAADANGKSDPYVIVKLGNEQRKTKPIQNTLSPVWNEEMHFVPVTPDQEISFQVMDEDILKDDKLGRVVVKLSDLKVGQILEKDYKLEDVKTGMMTIVLHLADAKDTPFGAHVSKPKEKKKHSKSHCSNFTLGSYSSSYSTSFSGYTNCSTTLSALSSSEEVYHIHKVYEKKEYKIKPKNESLKGVIVGCNNLIKSDSDGSDTYVTLRLLGKEHAKGEMVKTQTIHDTQDPVYNKEFEFKKVKKGEQLEIIVYQDHKILKDVPIGIAKIDVRDLDDGEAEKVIQLHRPPKLPKLLEKFTDFGVLKIRLDHHKEF